MGNKSGIVHYFNEMFLGREELLKRQTMERSALVKILKIFGQKGLFDLEGIGALLKSTYDPQAQNCTFTLELPDLDGMFLGVVGDSIVSASKSSTLTIHKSYPGNPTSKVYLSLQPAVTSFEPGTISVSNDGTVIGTGTNFTEILRGGSRRSKIKVSNYVFAVNHVENDTLLYLQGNDFPTLSASKFSILPTVSPFSQLNEEDIYEYDDCRLFFTSVEPDEENLIQIYEGTWADLIGSTATTTLKFNQKSLLRRLGNNSVGEVELKDNAVTNSKLDLELKSVDNLSVTSTVTSSPYVISIESSLKFLSEKDCWRLIRHRIAPGSNISTLPISTTLPIPDTYPQELKFVIDRIAPGSGHAEITISCGGQTIIFPAASSRVVICLQKSVEGEEVNYVYLYHVIC